MSYIISYKFIDCIVDVLVLKLVDGSNFFDMVWQVVSDGTGVWLKGVL